MATVNFDDPNVPITHGVNFDTMTAEEVAAKFGVDASSGKRLAALVASMAGKAHDQATLNKLVASAIVLGTKAVAGGVNVASLLGPLA